MATKFPEVFAALAAPFPDSVVRRRSHDGKEYITARAAMNRLDEVLGPENWTAQFTQWGQDAVYCRLTITLPDETTITKEDVGANSSLSERSKGADPGEDDKGGVADALKRAAVQFGVARYLYGDGVPRYAGQRQAAAPAPTPAPPPAEAAPERSAAPAPARRDRNRERERYERAGRDRDEGDDAPRTGGALFAALKRLDEEHPDLRVLQHVERWMEARGVRGRMKEYNREQVADAWGQAIRFQESLRESERLQSASY